MDFFIALQLFLLFHFQHRLSGTHTHSIQWLFLVYTANSGIICYLPPFRGTRNNHWSIVTMRIWCFYFYFSKASRGFLCERHWQMGWFYHPGKTFCPEFKSSRATSFLSFLFKKIHPWRLTWNIIMEVWKIIFLSKWVICRFHVNLPGCTLILQNVKEYLS